MTLQMHIESTQPVFCTVVLAVEDEVLRERLAQELRHDGRHVVEVEDGFEALDYINLCVPTAVGVGGPPDVIVAETKMSGLGARGLCEYLRARGDETPFIFLANDGSGEAFVDGEKLAADFVLTSPVDADELCDAVFCTVPW